MSAHKSTATVVLALLLSFALLAAITACGGIKVTTSSTTTKAGATTATTKAGATTATTKAGATTATTKSGATTATTKSGATTATAKPGATTTLAGGLSWPTDKMGDLPKVNARLDSAIQADKGYMIGFSSFAAADAAKYVQALKDKGYASTLEMNTGTVTVYYGTNAKGDTAYFMYDSSSSSGSISYLPKA